MNTIDRSAFKTLGVQCEAGILTITLSRPTAKNAVDQVMHRELSEVFQLAERDESARLVILTGAGDAFSSGGDLAYMKYMLETPGAFAESALEARRIVFGLLDLTKPVIARVNGDAIGLGATLALMSDVVVAANEARIGDPHVRVGLVAGDGGAVIWPALVGYARAKAALLTGQLIPAPRAAEIGLITAAVPKAELDDEVARWIRDLDAGSTMAVRYTKMALNIGLKQQAAAVLDASLGFETVTAQSADHAEAVQAFAEHRRPAFSK